VKASSQGLVVQSYTKANPGLKSDPMQCLSLCLKKKKSLIDPTDTISEGLLQTNFWNIDLEF
jgi:hypothetical protein